MVKPFTTTILWALCFARFLAAAAAQETVPRSDQYARDSVLCGRWKNINPQTDGVKRLNIDRVGNQYEIHAWGACAPDDCDWGTANLFVLDDPPAVVANDPRPPVLREVSPYGFATWNDKSGTTHLSLEFKQGQLHVQGYVIDGAYRLKETFECETQAASSSSHPVVRVPVDQSTDLLWEIVSIVVGLAAIGMILWRKGVSRNRS